MNQRSFGFTRVDLVIALALLGLLAGVALPAVGDVKEKAAQLESRNNLKNLALAAHNYHDAFKRFPAGMDSKGVSAHYYLLPYLEVEKAWKALGGANPLNPDKTTIEKAAKVRIAAFISPLDPVAVASKDKAVTNYLFNAGSRTSLIQNDGAFYHDSKVRLTVIASRDGASNTVLAGETLIGAEDKPATVARQHVLLTDKKAAENVKDETGAQDFKDGKNLAGNRGHNWADGGFLQTLFSGTRKANDARPDVSLSGMGGLSGLRALGKTVNVALCDASVRSVNVGISQDTWRIVCGANDGQVTPNEWDN